jgi:hypothetical protein
VCIFEHNADWKVFFKTKLLYLGVFLEARLIWGDVDFPDCANLRDELGLAGDAFLRGHHEQLLPAIKLLSINYLMFVKYVI